MARLTYPQYVNFVKQNLVRPALLKNALSAVTEPLDPNWPNILVSYYSLPDHLNIFDVDTTMHVSLILQDYLDTKKRHHDSVKAALATIANPSLGTGQALLKEILANRPRTVRIMPHDHLAKDLGITFDADTEPVVRAADLSTLTGTFAGLHSGNEFNTRDTNDKKLFDFPDAFAFRIPIDGGAQGRGTGKGTDALIVFTPEVFDPHSPGRVDAPGFDADEILYHELVHASRMLRGAQLKAAVIASWSGAPNNASWTDEEEYLAILITDMYMSEKGNSDLRRRHNGLANITDVRGFFTMQDPDTFYDQNPDHMDMSPRRLMSRFEGGKQRDFFYALARLPVGKPKFNPPQRFEQELKAGKWSDRSAIP